MRALVFGGSGQIGRAVAVDLAQAGWQVDAVVRAGRPLPAEAVSAGWTRPAVAPLWSRGAMTRWLTRLPSMPPMRRTCWRNQRVITQ